MLKAQPTVSSNENLATPVIRGDTVSIAITQEIYEKGTAFCKRHLRGRLVLNKGDKPYLTRDLQLKLQKQWTTTQPWTMLSLGRGYYEFFFYSEADLRTVWARGTVNLKPGLLRLFEWSKDFNMHKQRNTHAQVWIRLLELPQEYWMEQTLREIASAVGTPLIIDNATTKRIFGHYARILVDMDFTRKIFHEIVVERVGYSFTVEVAYERMPDFCTHCHNIGHDVTACRWLYPRKEKESVKEKVAQGKKQVPQQRLEWISHKDNPSGIGSSTAFQDPKHVLTPTVVGKHSEPVVPPSPQQQLETHPEPVAPSSPQQESLEQEVPEQNNTSTEAFIALEVTLQADDVAEHTTADENLAQQGDTSSPQENLDSVNKEFESTYTFEDQTEVTTTRTDQLPSTSLHVLEEIDVEENIVDRGNEQDSTAANVDHDALQLLHAANNVPPRQQHVHSSMNIQNGLDLWARIREYDQRMADEGFTQVLTKAQKQNRKMQVIGKPYQTRAKGGPPSSK